MGPRVQGQAKAEGQEPGRLTDRARGPREMNSDRVGGPRKKAVSPPGSWPSKGSDRQGQRNKSGLTPVRPGHHYGDGEGPNYCSQGDLCPKKLIGPG